MGSGLNWIVPDPQWGEPLTECPRPGHGPSLDPRFIAPMSGGQSQPLETLPDVAIPGSGSGNAGPGLGGSMGPRCCDVSHLLGLSWICLPPSLG